MSNKIELICTIKASYEFPLDLLDFQNLFELLYEISECNLIGTFDINLEEVEK